MPVNRICLIVFTTIILTNIGWAQTSERTVAISGTGYAMAEPDLARINMTVVERNASLDTAQQAADSIAGKVLAVLESLDIARKHINTTAAMIRPDYKWNRTSEEQELRGYIVERRINVTLHDLGKLGSLIEQITQVGVNQLSPPQLDSSKRRDLHREALANALADARANAATLAKASGNNLGKVLSISTGGAAPPPRPMMRAQADAALTETTGDTYTPGELRFDASVRAIYELLD
jgi:uncharacterized protein YggE